MPVVAPRSPSVHHSRRTWSPSVRSVASWVATEPRTLNRHSRREHSERSRVLGSIAALAIVGSSRALLLRSQRGSRRRHGRPRQRPLRHDRRRRRLLAGLRPGGLDRRVPDRQPRRHHQLRPRAARARVARPSSPAASTSPAPTRPSSDEEIDGRLRRLRRRHRLHRDPRLHLPDRRDLQRRGRRRAQPRRRRPSPTSSRATITNVERPGHRRAQHGRHASRPRPSPPSTARTTRAPPRTSRTTSTRSPPTSGTPTPADPFPYQTGEGAQGTSGVVDAVTNGTNTIGYADASKAGDLGVAKIKVGDEFVALHRRGRCRGRRGVAARRGPRATTTSRSSSTAPPTDPSHYPLVLVSLHHRLHRVRGRRGRSSSRPTSSYITSDDGQAGRRRRPPAPHRSSADLSAKVADGARRPSSSTSVAPVGLRLPCALHGEPQPDRLNDTPRSRRTGTRNDRE